MAIEPAWLIASIAPTTLAFASVSRSRGQSPLGSVAFVAGYLAVWAVVGLVPLAVIEVLDQLYFPVGGGTPARLGGLVIVVAGIYQFTPLKDTCLRACRSPLGFLLGHDFGSGPTGAFRAGASHGLYCLGCCWALMAVLAVIGLMNIAWMAAFAVIFFIEKNVPHGRLMPKAVGAACIVGGLAVIAWPIVLG